MAELHQLKKRAESVKLTAKVASAMKGISAAKLSRLNSAQSSMSAFLDKLAYLNEVCAEDTEKLYPLINPSAPELYIVIGANRGMCGSFHNMLISFADSCIPHNNSAMIVTCGKKTASDLDTTIFHIYKQFIVSDTPDYEAVEPIAEFALKLYTEGTVSAVKTVYMEYINTMVQQPVCKTVLPFKGTENAKSTADCLIYPDREKAAEAVAEMSIKYTIYGAVLSTAAGAQAATLTAMRSAYDNADEIVNKLNEEISKKRQASITASVIETSQDTEEEENVFDS